MNKSRVIRINAPLHRRLLAAAKADGKSVSQVIEQLLAHASINPVEILERIQDMLDIEEIERNRKAPGFRYVDQEEAEKVLGYKFTPARRKARKSA